MEKLVNTFKKLILLDIFLFVTLFISYVFYYDVDSEIIHSSSITPIEYIAILLLLINIILYYLLLRLKPLGKKLFIPLIIVSALITLLLPDDQTIYPNFVYLLEWFSGMTWGAIFTFMYFTELKNKFDK